MRSGTKRNRAAQRGAALFLPLWEAAMFGVQPSQWVVSPVSTTSRRDGAPDAQLASKNIGITPVHLGSGGCRH